MDEITEEIYKLSKEYDNLINEVFNTTLDYKIVVDNNNTKIFIIDNKFKVYLKRILEDCDFWVFRFYKNENIDLTNSNKSQFIILSTILSTIKNIFEEYLKKTNGIFFTAMEGVKSRILSYTKFLNKFNKDYHTIHKVKEHLNLYGVINKEKIDCYNKNRDNILRNLLNIFT